MLRFIHQIFCRHKHTVLVKYRRNTGSMIRPMLAEKLVPSEQYYQCLDCLKEMHSTIYTVKLERNQNA